MFRQLPVSAIAACFGMAAFSVAIVSGLGAGQSADSILWNALLASFICYPLGITVGIVARHAVSEHVAEYCDAHPVPELDRPDAVDLPAPPASPAQSA